MNGRLATEAVSFAGDQLDLLDTQRDWLERVVRTVIQVDSFPRETLLNINLPPIPAIRSKGFAQRLSGIGSTRIPCCARRIPGVGRGTGSAAARSVGRAAKTPTSGRSVMGISRSHRFTST